MESKGDRSSEEKEEKGRGITITTPDKDSNSLHSDEKQAFFENEARRPMKVATHFLGGSKSKNKTAGKSSSSSQFQPSSPTDRMMSPCSRKLMRKKSSIHDSGASDVNFDFWSPPPCVQLVLGSSSKARGMILREMGWNFSTMSPDIDERAIEVGR